jgi:hypothetical protein
MAICPRYHTSSLSFTNQPTSSPVQPNIKKHTTTAAVPKAMNGRLLPQRLVLLSDSIPITGCMIRPDSGPATHTRLNLLLLRPSDRRYGEAYVISVPQQNCSPIILKVSRIICIVSDEPLMRGWFAVVHCAGDTAMVAGAEAGGVFNYMPREATSGKMRNLRRSDSSRN